MQQLVKFMQSSFEKRLIEQDYNFFHHVTTKESIMDVDWICVQNLTQSQHNDRRRLFLLRSLDCFKLKQVGVHWLGNEFWSQLSHAGA